MLNMLVIALGGAIGAVSRYEVGLWITNKWNHNFPLATFAINISGAFLLGFLNIVFIEKFNCSYLWRMGICVGFLGAFTTFSTFGYEVITLIERREIPLAALYSVLSLIIGFAGVAIGVALARIMIQQA